MSDASVAAELTAPAAAAVVAADAAASWLRAEAVLVVPDVAGDHAPLPACRGHIESGLTRGVGGGEVLTC